MKSERRTYQQTYFWAFIGCIFLTIVLDHFNISVKESTEYATSIIKKTIENINQILLWFFPTALLIKKVFEEWTDKYFQSKIEIEKIRSKKEE